MRIGGTTAVEYVFGDHVLNVARRELHRGTQSVAVEPQVFDLLVYLLQNRDRVVSKDDLIASIWGGRVVSDSTLTSRINAARRAVGDDGERQALIRTIARKGVLFVGSVREQSSGREQAREGGLPVSAQVRTAVDQPLTGENQQPFTTPATPERPSIAVLPLAALGTGKLEELADGLTEDIITQLTRIGGLAVCARNTSFTYKGRPVDAKEAGRSLGARYLVEGSVRQAGGMTRVTAQLIEATTGNHIWAERYDRECADSFALQDEVTRGIVASVQTQIRWHEGLLIERSGKPDLNITEATARGWKEVYQLTRESLEGALGIGRSLVGAAPGSPKGHQLIGAAAYQLTLMGFTEPFGALRDTALTAVHEALQRDDRDEFSHWILGMVQGNLFGRCSEALSAYAQALEINPNFSLAFGSMGSTFAHAGCSAEALEKSRLSIQMDPRHPASFFRYSSIALAYFIEGENREALDWAERTISRKSNWWLGYALAAASRARLGQLDAARGAVEVLVSLLPAISLTNLPFIPLTQPAQLEELRSALKRAGLPE
jgi:adenylate cyclase